MTIKNNLIFGSLIITLIFISLISSCYADTDTIGIIPSIPEVKQFTSVSLPQSGSNGTAAWIFCNITTIYAPNHDALIKDVVMTKRGSVFNYTLTGSYTSTLGTYIVEGICGDGNNFIPFAYQFSVTTTGGESSISLWIALILIVVAIILFIMAIMLDSEYIGFISGIIFIVAGLYVMVYGFGNMADMYTRAIGIVLLALGLLIFFISAFYAYDDPEANGFKRLLGLDNKQEDVDETDQFQRTREDD
jgi:hypothetical protein